jgi:glycosyltransferase involved in cell wall biosynthesis
MIAPTIQNDQGFVDGDPAIFAHLADELIADAPRRQSLVETGHRSWLDRFTWEKLAVDYESLYQSLL